jgi:hypothetical protein
VSREEEEEEASLSNDEEGFKPHSTPGTADDSTILASNNFIRHLDYPEDDDDASGILHMEEPKPDDPTFISDKSFLTPASGDPSTNPAFSQRLLNPDLYGGKTTTKSVAMVNSKIQWNGKRSSFDEFKALLEGHFEGYGASYLVNRKFMDTYAIHGYKVLRFFPCLRIDRATLEQHNVTLFGSIKQICRKGAGRSILRKHEPTRNGMGTWLGFLKWYDNQGSSDVLTIRYDEVIARHYHRKYQGGLEQFAADYEEAYTELEILGEVHTDQARRRRILTNLYDPTNEETKLLV